ncbi:MAG: sigma-54 dependent transcriptional regulator [candidate division KSB1 bacterium]|nr:sigma-54 dependent transcriptional regulator [candidate division KSB1 bacterium]
MARILIVDDHENTRFTLSVILKKEGFQLVEAEDGQKAITLISQDNFDLVITDLKMEKVDGFKILNHVKQVSPNTEVIVITAYATIDSAVKAMKLGAYDYISKPFQREEIVLNVKKALEKRRLTAEVQTLQKQVREKYKFENIIGNHEKMVEVLKLVEKVASVDVPVLILGESGTGKELIAKAIHNSSNRRDAPFVVINCGALPENLQESELFGHVKGAFTGAILNKKGLFEEANGGTIFLDEIGEMSLSTQVKLLRVIQNGEVRPVGGNTPTFVNTRLIVASNRDLKAMVKRNEFREDLLFRINVVQINLPPLRDRRSDIPLLVDHFLKKFSQKLKKNVRSISPSAFSVLMSYPWPGNVRELENVIERAVILTKGEEISLEDFPAELMTAQGYTTVPLQTERKLTLEEIEKNVILSRLHEHNWNKARTAVDLGIGITTLWRKIKKYNLRPS